MNMIEYNDELDSKLMELVERFPRSYFKKITAKANKHLLDYVNSCTPLLQDDYYLVSTKTFWTINHMQDFPRCQTCGKPFKKNVKINEGYPKYCRGLCTFNSPEVTRHRELAYSARYGEGITNPFQAKEVIRKIDETNLRKYGVRRFTQTDQYKDKVSSIRDRMEKEKYATHKKNSSFNESKYETIAFDILRKKYPDLTRSYKSESYPFTCDFHSDEHDLYIEYNGTWTHGGHFFDENRPEDLEKVKMWRDKGTGYYDNAIYTWTDLDPRKMKCALDNNLNYLVFWTIDEVYRHVFGDNANIFDKSTLEIQFNRKKLEREFEFYESYGKCDSIQDTSKKNFIVKFFQQDTFFHKEKELWRNDNGTRTKIIENRCRYLDTTPESLTDDDLLTGFKKSGMHYGYSHFNPLWFKYFIDKFNIKTCYDPCGGWGHRLLGGLSLEKYIYNDLSKTTKENVDRMIDYFRIQNAETHCEDASRFVPTSSFEAMFTCPPYYNLEKYECGGFETKDDYQKFMDSLFNVFNRSENCRLFGLVTREDLLCGHEDFKEKFQIPVGNSSHLNDGKKKLEYMYIYEK